MPDLTHLAPAATTLPPAAAPHILSPSALWVPLLGVMAVDSLGLDLPVAHWFGSASGFALKDHWLLSSVLHNGARNLGWWVLLALTVCIFRPVGILKWLSRRDRAWMVASIWLSLSLVVSIKGMSQTSCPWDLDVFGGAARHVSHWAWGVTDGGGGHCFPAGHASTGFAFLAGCFWLRPVSLRHARYWFLAVMGIGLLLGLTQQLRGAHFLSHTLWTAWICWAVGFLVHRWASRASAGPIPESAELNTRRA